LLVKKKRQACVPMSRRKAGRVVGSSTEMPRDFMIIAAVCTGLHGCSGKSTERPPGEPHHGGDHGHHGHHHRFDDAASWSKVFDDPARDEWQKPAAVIASMRLAPDMRVADVGAGTGYFEPHLSKAVGPNGKVLAIDIEADMVRWTNERAKREGLANVEARLGAADDPKLEPASLDRVLVVDTWHHVEDRAAYAKKLAAALRPGGIVFIVDFTKESPHGPPPHARLTPDEVSADLRGAGLEPKQVEAGLPHQWMIGASRPSTL
jgi:ubiquinone/menaquinone biosynthesis C-methylase UbiE